MMGEINSCSAKKLKAQAGNAAIEAAK